MIGLGLGLPHHFWYSFLDRILPGTRLLTIAGKIMLVSGTISKIVLDGNQAHRCGFRTKQLFLHSPISSFSWDLEF